MWIWELAIKGDNVSEVMISFWKIILPTSLWFTAANGDIMQDLNKQLKCYFSLNIYQKSHIKGENVLFSIWVGLSNSIVKLNAGGMKPN